MNPPRRASIGGITSTLVNKLTGAASRVPIGAWGWLAWLGEVKRDLARFRQGRIDE